jgi:pyruvate formate lyase activating enzyme
VEAAYQKSRGEVIACALCPHNCLLKDGGRGLCGTRENQGGRLVALNYGQCTALAMDPIEKKPLYHFHPGSQILSVGTWGCNLACPFCQNWSISQGEAQSRDLSPGELVALAQREKSIGIAYTYSEPLVWYEYVFETAQRAREVGLKNLLVTNGFLNPRPWARLLPYIDGVNIDLKSLEEDFYRRIVKGKLQPVLDNILAAAESTHLELTNLLLPGLNDGREQVGSLVRWIARELGRDIPLHLSRSFPAYRWQGEPTDGEHLIEMWRKAREELDFVYIGNLDYPPGRDTYCPDCGQRLIKRGPWGVENSLIQGDCPHCGRAIPVVM